MNIHQRYFYLFFILHFLQPSFANASLEIGSGMSSMIGGRVIPAFDLAITTTDRAYTFLSTGVQSSYYYQSSYQLGYYKIWSSGSFLGGDIQSGVGASIAYSLRGFQDQNSTTETKATDYLGGPALRMNLSYGFIYINMSIVFGLRSLTQHLIGLTYQDISSLSFGVRF